MVKARRDGGGWVDLPPYLAPSVVSNCGREMYGAGTIDQKRAITPAAGTLVTE